MIKSFVQTDVSFLPGKLSVCRLLKPGNEETSSCAFRKYSFVLQCYHFGKQQVGLHRPHATLMSWLIPPFRKTSTPCDVRQQKQTSQCVCTRAQRQGSAFCLGFGNQGLTYSVPLLIVRSTGRDNNPWLQSLYNKNKQQLKIIDSQLGFNFKSHKRLKRRLCLIGQYKIEHIIEVDPLKWQTDISMVI